MHPCRLLHADWAPSNALSSRARLAHVAAKVWERVIAAATDIRTTSIAPLLHVSFRHVQGHSCSCSGRKRRGRSSHDSSHLRHQQTKRDRNEHNRNLNDYFHNIEDCTASSIPNSTNSPARRPETPSAASRRPCRCLSIRFSRARLRYSQRSLAHKLVQSRDTESALGRRAHHTPISSHPEWRSPTQPIHRRCLDSRKISSKAKRLLPIRL